MPDIAAPDRSLSRERLVTFAFAAAELLVEIAPDASITWAAGAFPARFGEPAERFVGRKLSSLIAPADHDALGRTLINAALCGHVPPVMLRLSDAAGTPCALAALILPGPQRRLCVTLGPVPVAPPANADGLQPASLFAKEVEARLHGKHAGRLALLDIKGWPAATDDAGDQQRSALRDAVGDALGSVAGPGAIVGEVAAGRYGVLSQRQLDIARLASGLEALIQARPDGGAVSVDSQTIGLSAPGLKPAQATRALRFALARFAASGAAAVAGQRICRRPCRLHRAGPGPDRGVAPGDRQPAVPGAVPTGGRAAQPGRAPLRGAAAPDPDGRRAVADHAGVRHLRRGAGPRRGTGPGGGGAGACDAAPCPALLDRGERLRPVDAERVVSRASAAATAERARIGGC